MLPPFGVSVWDSTRTWHMAPIVVYLVKPVAVSIIFGVLFCGCLFNKSHMILRLCSGPLRLETPTCNLSQISQGGSSEL